MNCRVKDASGMLHKRLETLINEVQQEEIPLNSTQTAGLMNTIKNFQFSEDTFISEEDQRTLNTQE